MRRASKLSTPEDFAIEERREEIRNSRTRRAMEMVLCISLALTLPGVDDGLSHLLAVLSRVVANV